MNSSVEQEVVFSPLDVERVRAQFPSLQQSINGQQAIFLDSPGGTQVPQSVMDAVRDYFERSNANTGGAFATSSRTDAVIADARAAMADLLKCAADEIFFGANMTTMTFALARAIGRELKSGDEIVVTTLDHDANVAPWRALEEECNVVVRQVDIDPADCTLDLSDLKRQITKRTRLVAVGYAANAVGTINPVRDIVRLAHEAGALAFIDAVHYAPHGLIDVRALDCDFLACSPYKFFGPHMGCIYGKRDHLLRFRPHKVRPSTDTVPARWETGTLNHEGLAGVTAAIDYLAFVGTMCGCNVPTDRRAAIETAYKAIRQHEVALMTRMIDGLLRIPGLRFFGIADPARFEHRVPTVGIRVGNYKPADMAARLGQRGIFTWDGNYYAVNLTERLGVEDSGGLLRIGLVHYNTVEEVDSVITALTEIAASECKNVRA
ncbi:MAG: cysteine desulfurase-like protein [Acidobacteriales bacterium]|nr:cysteine desulfurase-like protein [Terriglobales bacterium]